MSLTKLSTPENVSLKVSAMYEIAFFPSMKRFREITRFKIFMRITETRRDRLLKYLISNLKPHDPSFGYNVIKCHLITKADFVNDVTKMYNK